MRIEAAPDRPAMPALLPAIGSPHGLAIFVRRTTDAGRAEVLGRSYEVDLRWPHRLLRAELDFTAGRPSFFALRRREPTAQPLLAAHDYAPIHRHV